MNWFGGDYVKTYYKLLILGGLVACAVNSVLAASRGRVDFDQSIDIVRIFEEVENSAASDSSADEDFTEAGIVGILPLAERLPLPPVLRLERKMAAPYFFGPWAPQISGHPAYQDASQYPPRIRQLPSESRDPLERDWAGLETKKKDLLAEADQLEPQDRQLYTDSEWINKESDYLDGEIAGIDSARANYRARCNVSRPPLDCKAELRRLNDRIDRYNERIRIYNLKVTEWDRRRGDVEKKGKKLDADTVAWGASLAAFAIRAGQALEAGGESAIRVQAQGRDIAAPGGKSIALNVFGFVYLSQGKQVLGQVWEQLTEAERSLRQKALLQANRYMENAAAGGGTGPDSRTFFDDPNARDIRIDVVVFRGRAFVPDPASK